MFSELPQGKVAALVKSRRTLTLTSGGGKGTQEGSGKPRTRGHNGQEGLALLSG